MKCRLCEQELTDVVLDLGTAPLSNAFLRRQDLSGPESHFPLQLLLCHACRLVQLPAYKTAVETFAPDYVYSSSYSSSWVEHARKFVDLAIGRLGIDANTLVAEVASNDGYLLQHVVARGVRCFGVEPTASTAAAARERGVDTVEAFFGTETARSLANDRGPVDLLIANNVLAHVPDLHDFLEGLRILLKNRGTITLEFPHLLRLVEGVQFDTVYHEHYSYFSLQTACAALSAHGLRTFDVEQLDTHGGSLRLWVVHDADPRETRSSVSALLQSEKAAGLCRLDYFKRFQERVDRVRDDFVGFLIDAHRAGKGVGGYGAAAKGNTLLNYCGVKPSLLPYIADANPAKQGRFLPGSRIPVVSSDVLNAARPQYVVVLPWNLKSEIETSLAAVRSWGGKFVYAVPSLQTS